MTNCKRLLTPVFTDSRCACWGVTDMQPDDTADWVRTLDYTGVSARKRKGPVGKSVRTSCCLFACLFCLYSSHWLHLSHRSNWTWSDVFSYPRPAVCEQTEWIYFLNITEYYSESYWVLFVYLFVCFVLFVVGVLLVFCVCVWLFFVVVVVVWGGGGLL